MLKKITFAIVALFTALSANAGMISNQDLHVENLRGQVMQQLSSPQLIAAMEAHGVSQVDAQARIARLSSAELQQLSTQLDNAPAGGTNFITLIIIGFAIVVVTDALGYTDLFPFVQGPE